VEDHKLEVQLQVVDSRIDELHDELEQMLRRAKQISEESRRRVMATMGIPYSHHMFIRH